MSDAEDYHDSDSDGYDVHDPWTHEHEAYKIAQDNAGRATRRFRYGDDVDADGTDSDAHEEDNHDSMELRLQNAREARGWALDEATRRYEWNGRWAGGSHDGVEEEADKRMADVTRWNGEIEELEHLDQARDARAHNPDSDSDSSSDGEDDASNSTSGEEEDSNDSEEEYTKNIQDAREARKRRYDYDDQEEERIDDGDDDDDYEENDYSD